MGVSPAMLRLGAREDTNPKLNLNSILKWRMMTEGACMIGRQDKSHPRTLQSPK